MGLQTYNSLRALDWLSELPEVDSARIGVTGASGGGTQTFILSAIDPRPAVAFPAVMVSTAMQGGCTCENCSNLRVGTGNVEFAALAAKAMEPKPVLELSLSHIHAPTVSVKEQAAVVVDRLRRSGTMTFRSIARDAPDTLTRVARWMSGAAQ